MLLRSYCQLVYKICSIMESRTVYKDRARKAEAKLRDQIDDSEAVIRELTECASPFLCLSLLIITIGA